MELNPTLETIFSRRSIRSFKNKQITDEEINTILKAAVSAPSANNMQGWYFSVIQNKELIEELEFATRKGIMMFGSDKAKAMVAEPESKLLYNAPTLIVISTDEHEPKLLDVSAAAQNILLASWSMGIASCYLGATKYAFMTEQGDYLSKSSKIPEGYNHCVTIALGYMEGSLPSMPVRKKDVVAFVR